MSLALTKQELSFQRRVRAVTEKHLKPLAAKIEAEEYCPRDFLRALGRNKFLGAPFSRSYGGLALRWVSETIVGRRGFRRQWSSRDGKTRFGRAVLCAACIFLLVASRRSSSSVQFFQARR